jgi:YidC/Oxa1 family membrane protein insertase
MDKRFFLALLLTAIVIVAPPLLFPTKNTPRSPSTIADSASRPTPTMPAAAGAPVERTPVADSSRAIPAVSVPTPGIATASSGVIPTAVDTTTVRTKLARYAFSSRGAVPISIVLDSYPSRRPLSGKQASDLLPPRIPLSRYRLALGRDTIALDTVPLRAELQSTNEAASLRYTGTAAGRPVTVTYDIAPDSFLLHVAITAVGAPPGSSVLVELPRTLRSNEPDTLEDIGHLAVSYRTATGDIESVGFSKLDSNEVRDETRPVSWMAARNKYFLVAYRTPAKAPFTAVRLHGGQRTGKVANDLAAVGVLPLAADGRAAFDVYAGPQDFERLQKLGDDLDQVNPYGGFMQGMVQPFAVIVMRVLLWIKHTTQLNYGWVLVLFGVIIRLALWPLNQGAMRTSIKMQRLQPELQALQKRHSDDPRKQQEAIMKVYKEHGMSPLSPLMGCLPMLLPMPILFALYFVFQNTIEFRGVSFLWLPDISLRDPYFITPILMGVSMFVMSWVGMRNSPPNPQAKMMMYMMPVMLTVLFFNFASGLNLYYAVQNIAAIPQQWLIANERGKETSTPAATAVVRGTPTPAQKGRT